MSTRLRSSRGTAPFTFYQGVRAQKLRFWGYPLEDFVIVDLVVLIQHQRVKNRTRTDRYLDEYNALHCKLYAAHCISYTRDVKQCSA